MVGAKWTINIASKAEEIQPQHEADDWEIVNETGTVIMPKSRWRNGIGAKPRR